MILLDTSVWIEFLKGNLLYYPVVMPLLEKNEVLAFEPIFGELLQGARNERERIIISEYYKHLPKHECKDVFIKAGIESSQHRLLNSGVGIIDAAILVYSREAEAKVWTLDKKLKRLIPPEYQMDRPL